jgi:hypothetical protein
MITTSKSPNQQNFGKNHEQGWATYIPSPLLLYILLENGWNIAGAQLAPSEDQQEFVYIVSLKSDYRSDIQRLILPATMLIGKIIHEHQPLAVSVIDTISSAEKAPTL